MNQTLLALTGVLCALSGMAQSTMPWNPDANDDSYIGATDMLSTLAVYGQQFGIDSSLTCDYDGTPIEEFFGNVWNGDIIIDSMLVQYHTTDSAQVFIAGCPDPTWESVSYERVWTTNSVLINPDRKRWTISDGYYRYFEIEYESTTGFFLFEIQDGEVWGAGLTEILGHQGARPLTLGSNEWYIPFNVLSATFDENGIQFGEWSGFLSGATYVNILPYWHYAE